jgi:hypothetical protein
MPFYTKSRTLTKTGSGQIGKTHPKNGGRFLAEFDNTTASLQDCCDKCKANPLCNGYTHEYDEVSIMGMMMMTAIDLSTT